MQRQGLPLKSVVEEAFRQNSLRAGWKWVNNKNSILLQCMRSIVVRAAGALVAGIMYKTLRFDERGKLIL